MLLVVLTYLLHSRLTNVELTQIDVSTKCISMLINDN